MTDLQVATDIYNYIATNFGTDRFVDWYVGIASDPADCLFNRHHVSQTSAGWVARQAYTSSAARSAEALLLSAGFDGGSGGGDSTTVFVYAYRKVSGTNRQ